jgi:hypothetical protein
MLQRAMAKPLSSSTRPDVVLEEAIPVRMLNKSLCCLPATRALLSMMRGGRRKLKGLLVLQEAGDGGGEAMQSTLASKF